jgi:hypothetical protein
MQCGVWNELTVQPSPRREQERGSPAAPCRLACCRTTACTKEAKIISSFSNVLLWFLRGLESRFRTTVIFYDIWKKSWVLHLQIILISQNWGISKDIQVLQFRDVAQGSRDRSTKGVLLKLQISKVRQTAQRCRYGSCQVVPIQPPADTHATLLISSFCLAFHRLKLFRQDSYR